MQFDAENLVLSPSDLTAHLACEHRTQLELAALRGEIERPERSDPGLEVLSRRGGDHEVAYLRELQAGQLTVAEIETEGRGAAAWTRAAEETAAAMRAGADIVYQATFFDGRWLGFADFLRRVERASELGDHSYEVEDTKLARQVKAAALLQTCAYSDFLEPIQGLAPERIHIVQGDMERRSFALGDYAAYYRSVKHRFEETVDRGPHETYPEPVGHCSVCRWAEICDERRREDDHLSLVAGIRGGQIRKLASVGVKTLADLAVLPADAEVPGIGAVILARIRRQAALQMRQRETGEVSYEFLPAEGAGMGLAALPVPSEGDLFFDIEGDPFVGEAGLEYLFGIVEVVGGEPRFHAFWAHSPAEEKRTFEDLVDFIVTRLDRDPGLHVYHYAAYEETALKRLMGRHATREEEVDRLLRGRVLVDLFRVVRQGLRISTESYSLKKLEPLYMEVREGEIKDAASSIVAYEEWLESREERILEEIADYNEVDCISTWKLRDWLEERRAEVRSSLGGDWPRPEPGDAEPSEKLAEVEAENQRLLEDLTRGLPEDEALWSDADRALYLLGHLLGWHRREAKSEWWAYFTRLELTDEELVEDSEAMGELEYEGEVDRIKRSVVHRYRFDPAQDQKIGIGGRPVDPRTEKSAGVVFDIDGEAGYVDLKRGLASKAPHPRSLIPGSPVTTTDQRAALRRVAHWVATHDVDGPGKYRAARELLLGRSPRLADPGASGPLIDPGADIVVEAKRVVAAMEETTLAMQGPPGSGKTYTGARVIVDLVESGKKVGVTANSHKVIDNLLAEVCKVADDEGVPLRALHKGSPEGDAANDRIEYASDYDKVQDELASGGVNVVGGTAWLFSRERFEGRFDTLFVDEAGQLSLANAVAVGGAARNLVLLGDPRQLAQPSKGSHPPGTEVSALEHLLAGRRTIPAEEGIFLAETWRLRPEICEFISEVSYQGRLRPAEKTSRHVLEACEGRGGTGLRLLAVPHTGNRTASVKEAERVAEAIDGLLGLTWTHADGGPRPLGLDDILVVAPYNAQVACLRNKLPEGARVGTVDKFQGQEAPVVFYSMATSDPEQVPRGIDFLFSLNRLNVAVSRAQALSVLVCSPALFKMNCRRPEEMRLVNAHCRFGEMAT